MRSRLHISRAASCKNAWSLKIFEFAKKVLHTGISVSNETPKRKFLVHFLQIYVWIRNKTGTMKVIFLFVFDENSGLSKSKFLRFSFSFQLFICYNAFANNDTNFFECFYRRQKRENIIYQIIILFFFQLKFLIVFPSISFSLIFYSIYFFNN